MGYIHVSVLGFVNLVKPASYSDINLIGFSLTIPCLPVIKTYLRNMGTVRNYEKKNINN